MHIQILRGVQIEGEIYKPGAKPEVTEGIGRMLISTAKAKQISAPKPKAAKEAKS